MVSPASDENVCPFCCSEDSKVYHAEQGQIDVYYVICIKCLAHGPARPTEKDALLAWKYGMEQKA